MEVNDGLLGVRSPRSNLETCKCTQHLCDLWSSAHPVSTLPTGEDVFTVSTPHVDLQAESVKACGSGKPISSPLVSPDQLSGWNSEKL